MLAPGPPPSSCFSYYVTYCICSRPRFYVFCFFGHMFVLGMWSLNLENLVGHVAIVVTIVVPNEETTHNIGRIGGLL